MHFSPCGSLAINSSTRSKGKYLNETLLSPEFYNTGPVSVNLLSPAKSQLPFEMIPLLPALSFCYPVHAAGDNPEKQKGNKQMGEKAEPFDLNEIFDFDSDSIFPYGFNSLEELAQAEGYWIDEDHNWHPLSEESSGKLNPGKETMEGNSHMKESMKRATVLGCACVITSDFTATEIGLFKRFLPEALVLADENGNTLYQIELAEDGEPGCIEQDRIAYCREKVPGRKATVTTVLDPSAEDKEDLVRNRLGQALIRLDALEAQMMKRKDALQEKMQKAVEHVRAQLSCRNQADSSQIRSDGTGTGGQSPQKGDSMSDKTFITSEGIIVREEDLTPEQRAEMEELECEEFEPEYISEEDFARGEGFWIDEDGHWVPLDDEDDW